MRTPVMLAEARRKRSLSQRALARRAGVDPGSVSRYEAGLKIPRSDTVESLFAELGQELDLRPTRSANARFVDALCQLQADALLEDPSLLDAAVAQLPRLRDRSAQYETWQALLDAGVLPVVAVLTSTSEAVRALKADSPLAYVIDVDDTERLRLREVADAS